MFLAEEDLTLHITRGDAGEITVRAIDEKNDGTEAPYVFKAGEVLRLKVYEKKNCSKVVLQKDFGVVENTEMVTLALEEADTKIGDTISKPVDYWYEIELNPFTEPQTIVGYDDDGAKILRLYPEGLDAEIIPPTPEELGTVDKELDLTSERAIQNQAVARAIVQLESTVEESNTTTTEELAKVKEDAVMLEARVNNLATIEEGSTTGDAELIDIRVGYDGTIHESAGESVRSQVRSVDEKIDTVENLFNINDCTQNMVISATGEETENTDYLTSDYIYTKGGKKYICSATETAGIFAVSLYDTEKNFINRFPSGVKELGYDYFISPYDCYYRISARKDKAKYVMVVDGAKTPNLPEDYYPYGKSIKKDMIPVVEGEKITDESISMNQTNFIKYNNNLINHLTIKKGYVIGTNGVETVNQEYAISDKIPLEKLTNYIYNHIFRLSVFDADDKLIGTYGTANSSPISFKTTLKSEYAIASFNLSSETYGQNWQLNKINEGDELPPFERQCIMIGDYRLKDEIDVEVDPIEVITNWNKSVIDKSKTFVITDESLYQDLPTDYTNAIYSTSSIYSLYDEMMSLPINEGYITKTALGVDTNGVTLYRYDFVEPNNDNTGVVDMFIDNKPKIILSSGTHNEYNGIFGLAYAMKEIATNPELIDLRRNIHFIVVPVLNSYGVNAKLRKNINGVDLARNFEVGFVAGTDSSSAEYSGTEPLSELECQYLDNIMAENKDAILYVSCHSMQMSSKQGSSGGTVQKPYLYMWGCSATKYFENISGKVIDKLSRAWRTKYDNIPDSPYTILGHATMNAPEGSEGKQAIKYGIQGGTFEVCDYFRYNNYNTAHTGFSLARASEVYVNLILTAVDCYDYKDKKLE